MSGTAHNALYVTCDRCGESLKEPGALVFGPPLAGTGRVLTVMKLHICVACWPTVFQCTQEMMETGA